MMELSLGFMLLLILSVTTASHPLVFCLGLVFFTLALGVITSVTLSKWVTYAIILIFLGGMMVIFIYMTTLASNEKVLFSRNLPLLTFMSALMASLFSTTASSEWSLPLIQHPFLAPSSPLILFLVVYLLMTLFIVVSLSKSFKGALIKFS